MPKKKKKLIYDVAFVFLILPIVTYISFSPANKPDAEFVFDDVPAVSDNPDVRASHTNYTAVFKNDFWGDPVRSKNSHKSYRPLTILLFRALKRYSRYGGPAIYRFAAMVLHATNGGLVFLLSRTLIGRQPARWVGLLFIAHPLRVEPVVTAVGLADLMCALLCLTAINLKAYNVFKPVVDVFMMTLLASAAVLFKEQGIMLVPMVFSLDILRAIKTRGDTKPNILRGLFYLQQLCVTMYLRLKIMGFQGPTFQQQDNPTSFLPGMQWRAVNRLYQYALNAWLMLAPDWLCFDWAMGCVTLVETASDPRLILIAVFFTVCFVGAIKSLGKVLNGMSLVPALSISVLILSFLPSANIFFSVGFVIAERNLYLPLLGLQLLLVDSVKRLEKRYKGHIRIVLKAGLCFLVICFVARSRTRARVWQNEQLLFQSGLRVCPNNAKVHYNIAKRAADASDVPKAVHGYRQALELYPDYEQALNNLGNIYRKQGEYKEATELLSRAVEIKPDFAAAWMNLGTVQAAVKDFTAAETSYKTALSYRTPYADCWYNIGNLFLKTQRQKEALVAFREAIKQRPDHKRAWSNLILLEDEEGKLDLAEKSANDAIKRFPDEPEFHSHLAAMLGKQSRYEEAETAYLKSLSLRESSFVWGNLGVLYHRWKKIDQAKESYERALKLDPGNQSAKRNLETVM